MGSVAGVMIFLTFLLFAAQVAVHLYGVSTATAATFDLARRIATDPAATCLLVDGAGRGPDGDVGVAADGAVAGGDPSAPPALTGYLARPDVHLDCDDADPAVVRLTVRGPSPGRLIAGFGRAVGVDTVHRTVQVRVEDFVSPQPPSEAS